MSNLCYIWNLCNIYKYVKYVKYVKYGIYRIYGIYVIHVKYVKYVKNVKNVNPPKDIDAKKSLGELVHVGSSKEDSCLIIYSLCFVLIV